MGDDGAEDAGQVASGEGDSGLGALAVVGFLAGEAVVDHLNDSLKRGELHHRVRNLTAPERVETFVESILVVSKGGKCVGS